jgi:hypothetical protein
MPDGLSENEIVTFTPDRLAGRLAGNLANASPIVAPHYAP